MSASATPPVPFLDPTRPDFSMRSDAVRAAREQSWYATTPYGLAVLQYDAVKELVRHPALRQGSGQWPDHNQAEGDWARWWKRSMLNKEGEDHARLRRLAQPAFAPRQVTALRPRFERLATTLIDDIVDRGRCEFMADFAEPYASQIVCELIGIDTAQWRDVADHAIDMGYALSVNYKHDEARSDAALNALMAIAGELVAERRRVPADDFVGSLITAHDAHGSLSEQEVLDLIVISIFGGIDTTRGQIGLALACFLEHPDQWALLGSRPELARAAVDEVMRVRPTTTWVSREATVDFRYRDLAIAAGTTVHLFAAASGTDPAYFEAGFDITATRKPHFAFGGGKHHCIGSPVARSDMMVALTCLSQRLHAPRLAGPARWLPDSGNTGPLSLPIAFDRACFHNPQ
ncbi:MAG: cytochrome P450 [Pseudomonadota bacterium]